MTKSFLRALKPDNWKLKLVLSPIWLTISLLDQLFNLKIYIENIDEVCENIMSKLKQDVKYKLQRRGAVIGISGGIDSSVCMALSAKAFGPNKVTAVYTWKRRRIVWADVNIP